MPKLNGEAVGAGAAFFSSSFFCSCSGFSASTSLTSWFTAAEGLGVSAGLAPKLNGEAVAPDEGTLGVNPFGADAGAVGGLAGAALATPNENPPDGAEGRENPPAGGAGIEKPDFFGSSAFAGAADSGFHPAFLTASSRYLLYCSARPGSSSPRFTNASFSRVVVKNDRMDVLRPRIEV